MSEDTINRSLNQESLTIHVRGWFHPIGFMKVSDVVYMLRNTTLDNKELADNLEQTIRKRKVS